MSAAVGLIPAYAGKTASPAISFAVAGAHPRVCGENRILFPAQCQARGSSPRMRGKPSLSGPVITRRRLIPAYAGKTS